MIKELLKKCIKKEFIKFVLVGGTSALIDWGLFYLLAIILTLHYQISIIISFSCSVIFHYTFNKKFTFKSKSKKVGTQFSIFLVVVTIYILLSMGIMFILVKLVSLPKMISKISTTCLMFIVSYFLNKNLTFNKKFFN